MLGREVQSSSTEESITSAVIHGEEAGGPKLCGIHKEYERKGCKRAILTEGGKKGVGWTGRMEMGH